MTTEYSHTTDVQIGDEFRYYGLARRDGIKLDTDRMLIYRCTDMIIDGTIVFAVHNPTVQASNGQAHIPIDRLSVLFEQRILRQIEP